MKHKNPSANRRSARARPSRRATQQPPTQRNRAIQTLFKTSISATARQKEESEQS